MRPASRSSKIISSVMLASFSLVGILGEGLHLAPGLGHAIGLPNGGCVYLGDRVLGAIPDAATSGWQGTERDVRLLDGGECAVCSICAQSGLQTPHVAVVLDAPVVDETPRLADLFLSATTPQAAQPRAPPIS